MRLGLLASARSVSADDAARIAAVLTKQVVLHFWPKWGGPDIPAPVVEVIASETELDSKDAILVITDQEAAVMGQHDWNGLAYGYVYTPECGLLTDGADAISTVTSHEALELLADYRVDEWLNSPYGYIAGECCDPVSRDWYQIDGVSVSDFVFPSWFDPIAKGPFNYLDTLGFPFQLPPGGYVVQRAGEIKWGEDRSARAIPEWRRGARIRFQAIRDKTPVD